MFGKYIKILKLKIFIFIMTLSISAFANFGEPCSGSAINYNIAGNDPITGGANQKNEFLLNSLAGYIYKSIDPGCRIIANTNYCLDNNPTNMTICIISKPSEYNLDSLGLDSDIQNTQNYTKTTLLKGNIYRLSEISSNPVYKTSHFKNVRISVEEMSSSKEIFNQNNNPGSSNSTQATSSSSSVTEDNRPIKFDNLCLVLRTNEGKKPLYCKPLPLNAYNNFEQGYMRLDPCAFFSDACSLRGSNNSLFRMGFSGKMMQCISETLNMVFFDPRHCNDGEILDALKQNTTVSVRPFAELQTILQKSVLLLIALYIIFLGIDMMLEPSSVKMAATLSNFVKIILVIYFSVGFSALNFSNTKEISSNGVTEILLPTVTNFTLGFTELMTKVTNNYSGFEGNTGLCLFDSSKYPDGYKYYFLFDSLDCFLMTYLGKNPLLRRGPEKEALVNTHIIAEGGGMSGLQEVDVSASDTRPNVLKNKTGIPVITLIFSVFMGNGLWATICLVTLVMASISIFIRVLLTFMLSIIFIYFLSYLAVLTVPLSLFKKTVPMFQRWLNLLLATAIQPIIFVSLSFLILSIYNKNLFEGCSFTIWEEKSVVKKREFELKISPYNETKCTNSIGYQLYYGMDVAGSWSTGASKFFNTFPVYKMSSQSTESILKMAILLYILYFFIEKIGAISSALTKGIDFSNSIQTAINDIKSLPDKVKDASAYKIAKAVKDSLEDKRKESDAKAKDDDKDGKKDDKDDGGKGKDGGDGDKGGGGGADASQGASTQ